jgi:predicted secreted hydrolase
MKSRLPALLLAVLLPGAAAAPQFRVASPGYQYSFPRDYFNHPDYQTEWWYYTGNLRAADGHAFGFELTFFREGVQRESAKDSPWAIEDLYLAHAALSDIGGRKFYHTERLNRAGPGIAGVDEASGRIWNGNWRAVWSGEEQKLDAIEDEWTFHLSLDSKKPPVIHGEQGISRKGATPGEASHYISLTRLAASGSIELQGQKYAVEGTAWMDHEFFTNSLAADQAGWDWISIQLNDQTELMLYRMRRKDGSPDPYSSATYVEAGGKSRHLSARDFQMEPVGERWTSSVTGASYPIHWQVSVPSLALNLEVTTKLPQQEMTATSPSSPNYWEGAVEIAGTRGSSTLKGVGYLEMTGYDKPLRFGQ